ncbi:MAG: hypothetical protein F6K17_24810 [Okeania sp. SIO3C4]|nr:hypothetical protein [Okeania sp. SIO3C4]
MRETSQTIVENLRINQKYNWITNNSKVNYPTRSKFVQVGRNIKSIGLPNENQELHLQVSR